MDHKNPRDSLEEAWKSGSYVDITDWPAVRVDLRYGSRRNLLGEDVYGGFQRALLHPLAAEKFRSACALLTGEYPHWNFLIFDSLRPRSAQWRFWSLVENTPMQPYFADPRKGSVHNYGLAIDLSLLDEQGRELDMGTPFDSLEELAEPRREAEMLASGRLLREQYEQRLRLRALMESAGFLQLEHEWWHYDALPAAEVRARFSILE